MGEIDRHLMLQAQSTAKGQTNIPEGETKCVATAIKHSDLWNISLFMIGEIRGWGRGGGGGRVKLKESGREGRRNLGRWKS